MRVVCLGVTLTAIGLLTVSSLIGDDKKPDTKDPDTKLRGFLPKYFKQVGISDDQKQAVYRVQAKYDTKLAELQKKIKDLKAEEMLECEKVLTKAQMERLKELRAGEKTAA